MKNMAAAIPQIPDTRIFVHFGVFSRIPRYRKRAQGMRCSANNEAINGREGGAESAVEKKQKCAKGRQCAACYARRQLQESVQWRFYEVTVVNFWKRK